MGTDKVDQETVKIREGEVRVKEKERGRVKNLELALTKSKTRTKSRVRARAKAKAGAKARDSQVPKKQVNTLIFGLRIENHVLSIPSGSTLW